MTNSSHKYFNILIAGPDMFFGHSPTERPDYAFPEPGPDNEYHLDHTKAPGYKLGSYLNLYNFDKAINDILDCDDWSTHLAPITRYVWDGTCHRKQTVGEESFLLIDRPDKNNIPRNVYVLAQKGMTRGTAEPLERDDISRSYYEMLPDGETDSKSGWWISDALKLILEEMYGWRFFEDVFLESAFEELPDSDDTWSGGLQKTFQDIQYHDLRIALNNEYNLSDGPDNRALGDRIDVLALFSYTAGQDTLTALDSATATLTGDCSGDVGNFQTVISWQDLTPANPDIYVYSYIISSQREPEADVVEIAEISSGDENLYEDNLQGQPTGIVGYPKYYISWKANDGSVSAPSEITKLPGGFNTYGIPSCQAEVILSGSPGDCWTADYGKLELSWSASIPPNTEISSIRIHKDESFETVDGDVRSWTDESVSWSGADTSHEYKIEAVITSLATGEIVKSVESDVYVHDITECVCDDDGEQTCQTKCWIREGYSPEVTLWMNNYIEHPFEKEPYAEFEISYCIEDKCSIGIEDFSLRLKLPEGFQIIEVESEHFSEVSFESDFQLGLTKDEWVLEAVSTEIAKPAYGSLCKIKIDKPIGTKRIEFVTEQCELELSGVNYTWGDNAQNVDAVPKWQIGPPLSVCTDEIDMGYGDYILKLDSIDLKTFDVNFCLSRDDFDTFFLVVMSTDFKTEVEEVDPLIGRAVNAGWDIEFKNISPGISVVMGNGSTPISSSGFDTLLRIRNDRAPEPFTPEESDDDGETTPPPCSSLCVFPFFLKLGDSWQKVKNVVDNYGKNKTNVQAQSSGGSYALQTTTTFLAASPAMYSSAPTENLLVQGMQSIEDNIDKRFRRIVNCLKEAYKNFLTKIDGPQDEYSSEDILKIGSSIQLFMTMISIFSTISVAKGQQINRYLDNIDSLDGATCNNGVTLMLEGSGQDEYIVRLDYLFPAGDIAGVQLKVDIPEGFSIIRDGLTGHAKESKYLQVLGSQGGYICVYDYSLGKTPHREHRPLGYVGQQSPKILTQFKVRWTGEGQPPGSIDDARALFGIVKDHDNEPIPLNVDVKLVTNKVLLNPTDKWSGDWYNVDQTKEVNVKDFLVACILATGVQADLAIADTVVVLPEGYTIGKKYFDNSSYDLSNISYNTSTWIGLDGESFQEYVLDYLDANGDGVADISDVVTVRNLFAKSGSTIIPKGVATSTKGIVPTEVCSIGQNIDLEFYIPDECSSFCIEPGCFTKLWVSDVITIPTKEGGVSDLLVEVSYAANCDGDDSLSGVSFTLSGLQSSGILATVNGSQGTPTAFKENNWDYHIISSSGNQTKDTIIAHATSSSNYLQAGTGVLTYLRIKPSSVVGELNRSEALQSLMHTNAYSILTTDSLLSIGRQVRRSAEALYATHQNTSELVAYKRFGIKVRSFEMTSNYDGQAPVEKFDSETNHNTAIGLLSGGYLEEYDADGDGKISLVDIQASYHAKNINNFVGMTDESILPSQCCPCDKPDKPKIVTASRITGEEFTLKKSSGWAKDRRFSLESFGCGGDYEGGVIIAWTPTDDTRYYTVYRRRANSNEDPVPVIGSKNGVIANRDQFKIDSLKFNQGSVRRPPEQIDTTVWIDFPPVRQDSCCDWEDGDDTPKFGETYEYFVVATNECGDTPSGRSRISIPCCNFNPKAMPEYIFVEGNSRDDVVKTHTGFFDVKTKDTNSNVYVYTNVSGVEDYTRKDGKFVVSSGPPSSTERNIGAANSFKYEYSPALNYYGPDEIKYFAVIESDKTKNWKLWCSDESMVNIFVIPPNAKVTGKSGSCLDEDLRGAAILEWEEMKGISSYIVFRDDEEIARLDNGETSFIDRSIAEESQADCEEDSTYRYAVIPVFVHDGESYSPSPVYTKVTIECCPEIENPELTINVEKDICSESGDKQDGEILLFWQDMGKYDTYKVYKRQQGSDWSLLTILSGSPEPDGMMRVRDSVEGCIGCTTIVYEYCVAVATISGDGEIGTNTVSKEFNCCQTKPVAKDQTFVIDDGLTIQKRLKAFDKDADIVEYVIDSVENPEGGDVVNFEPTTGKFTFQPKPLFYGEYKLNWTVVDSCSNTDSATLTIKVKGIEYCKEDDYIICNAALSYLTEQQDVEGARLKEDEIPQVPFSLNNKGVPSLRRRCGAFSITRGVDPSVFAIPAEGCLYVKFFPEDTSMTLPEVVVSTGDDLSFGSGCPVSTSDGIPHTVISQSSTLPFSDCETSGEGDTVSSVEIENNE